MLPAFPSLSRVPTSANKAVLAALVEQIEARQQHATRHKDTGPIATGWQEIDAALGGGVAAGALHEWFGDGDERTRNSPWFPPLTLISHVAHRATLADRRSTIWVGRGCWPYAPALIGADESKRLFVERSMLIDATTLDERAWAIDLALRCPAIATVIADGTGLKLAITRRLQLAAASGGAPCLLVRPPWELSELSAAKTRWRVRAERSESTEPRWTIELLRCKGVRPMRGEGARWVVRLDDETGNVSLVAAPGKRRDETEGSAERRTA